MNDSQEKTAQERQDEVAAALQAAVDSGLLNTNVTIGEVIKLATSGSVGTLGNAVAWDRYVLVTH